LKVEKGFEREREKTGVFSCRGKVLENQKVFQGGVKRRFQIAKRPLSPQKKQGNYTLFFYCL